MPGRSTVEDRDAVPAHVDIDPCAVSQLGRHACLAVLANLGNVEVMRRHRLTVDRIVRREELPGHHSEAQEEARGPSQQPRTVAEGGKTGWGQQGGEQDDGPRSRFAGSGRFQPPVAGSDRLPPRLPASFPRHAGISTGHLSWSERNSVVEVAGIEPASSGFSTGLLRAQPAAESQEHRRRRRIRCSPADLRCPRRPIDRTARVSPAR